jgi:hypothetical protein
MIFIPTEGKNANLRGSTKILFTGRAMEIIMLLTLLNIKGVSKADVGNSHAGGFGVAH